MPVCISGMHRSGTSVVAHLLHLCGLELGLEEELIPATQANPDGHWEHRGFVEVNDEVLARLGGGWDLPPSMAPGWERTSALEPIRDAARRLLVGFEGRKSWGWKDPRGSLTFPFWNHLLPDLKAVVCIRNPLEVAMSLRRRGLSSWALGLSLWKIYNERILAATRPEGRIVTHYDSYMGDADKEMGRVGGFLGLDLPSGALERCCGTVKADLRHTRFSSCSLRELGVTSDIIELYLGLCSEAEYAEPAGVGSAPRPQHDLATSEAQALRRDLEQLGRAAADGAFTASVRGERVRRRRRRIATLRQQLAGVRDERDALRRALDSRRLDAEAIRADLQDLREELIQRDENLQAVLDELRASGVVTPDSARKLEYRQLVRRTRKMVRGHVPRGATVAVVSKGDEELVRQLGRRGWHFPQDERGVYAGYYPASGLAAVAHLEVLRSRGAEYLVLPATSSWWLDEYPDFKAHLEGRYRVAAHQEGTGRLYSLSQPAGNPGSEEGGARPTHLSVPGGPRSRPGDPRLGAGTRLAERLQGVAVFRPPTTDGRLPYVDRSVEVVAVASDAPDVLAEARRVAEVAILNFSPGDGRVGPAITWVGDLPDRAPPSVSIIIPVFNNWRLTAGCLKAVRETLPEEYRVEVIVIDDASRDGTGERLVELAAQDPRVRVLQNPDNAGFVDSCNRGAEAARGEFLVFLNNDTVPLPDWLPPLLQTFEMFPDAGGVGGKLLFPDGRLQEAGGIVFRDASAAHFGRGEPDAAQPLFNYVREVDYCSAALLATPRTLFEELGGFDPRFRPGYYEDADYCFRMRDAGRLVYYQPESVVVHLEGGTSGTDSSRGMKRHQVPNQGVFEERWRDALSQRPDRPPSLGRDAWVSLAWQTDSRGSG